MAYYVRVGNADQPGSARTLDRVDDEALAVEMVRVIEDVHPTAWSTILPLTPRPGIEMPSHPALVEQAQREYDDRADIVRAEAEAVRTQALRRLGRWHDDPPPAVDGEPRPERVHRARALLAQRRTARQEKRRSREQARLLMARVADEAREAALADAAPTLAIPSAEVRDDAAWNVPGEDDEQHDGPRRKREQRAPSPLARRRAAREESRRAREQEATDMAAAMEAAEVASAPAPPTPAPPRVEARPYPEVRAMGVVRRRRRRGNVAAAAETDAQPTPPPDESVGSTEPPSGEAAGLAGAGADHSRPDPPAIDTPAELEPRSRRRQRSTPLGRRRSEPKQDEVAAELATAAVTEPEPDAAASEMNARIAEYTLAVQRRSGLDRRTGVDRRRPDDAAFDPSADRRRGGERRSGRNRRRDIVSS
jgi:hypothetical protein